MFIINMLIKGFLVRTLEITIVVATFIFNP